MERLSKILARAGAASRRGAEELIAAGRVTVNGRVVVEQGVKVDPQHDHIKLDGKLIGAPQPLLVIAVHKPAGYVTTADDPEERPTVFDLVQRLSVRLFPVGRLDWDAEGLLLLTNDGELAQRLTHPKFGVEKIYVVKVKGRPDPAKIKQLRSGVMLDDGLTAPAKVTLLRSLERNSWLRLTIKEGRQHQVKRMCEAIGHPVIKLVREGFGPLQLGDLAQGEWRQLEPEELRALKQAARGERPKTRGRGRGRNPVKK